MAKVVSLNGLTRPEEIKVDIVDALERWLEMARNGEFKALALCAITSDNGSKTAVCRSDNTHALLGAIVHAQYDLIHSYDEK